MGSLYIDASVRGKDSRTRALAEQIKGHLGGNWEEINLRELTLLPLNEERLAKKQELLSKSKYDDPSFALARQIKEAERVLIIAPCYDYLYPALLKLYIENITHMGITFDYDELGRAKGLTNIREVFYVTTAGGYLDEDIGYLNIKAVFNGLFGVKSIHRIAAEGLDIVGCDIPAKLKQALQEFKNQTEEKK